MFVLSRTVAWYVVPALTVLLLGDLDTAGLRLERGGRRAGPLLRLCRAGAGGCRVHRRSPVSRRHQGGHQLSGPLRDHAPVSRRQMALFPYRLLDPPPAGPGGIDVEDAFPEDRHFEDLYNQPLNVYEAVRTLFELGVLEGTTSTTFSPSRKVARAETALALTRMLDHTNARPAGLTMQTDGVVVDADADAEVVISMRDRWHRPVPDALVDVFEWAVPSTRRVDPFDSRGQCEEDEVRASFGNDACVIDHSDDTTDMDGNLEYDVFVDQDLTLWAWSGDLRDRFDLDPTEIRVDRVHRRGAAGRLPGDRCPA